MRRGLTLVEVMVVTLVFGLLALLLLAIYQVGLRAGTKGDARDATYRASMLALENVKERLRGCQLVEPSDPSADPVPEASFRYPSLDEEGLLEVDGEGEPVWEGTGQLASDDQGRLVCTLSDGTTRVLAHLGVGGEASFKRLEDRMLEVRVLAVRANPDPNRSSRSELSARIALPNQP